MDGSLEHDASMPDGHTFTKESMGSLRAQPTNLDPEGGYS